VPTDALSLLITGPNSMRAFDSLPFSVILVKRMIGDPLANAMQAVPQRSAANVTMTADRSDGGLADLLKYSPFLRREPFGQRLQIVFEIDQAGAIILNDGQMPAILTGPRFVVPPSYETMDFRFEFVLHERCCERFPASPCRIELIRATGEFHRQRLFEVLPVFASQLKTVGRAVNKSLDQCARETLTQFVIKIDLKWVGRVGAIIVVECLLHCESLLAGTCVPAAANRPQSPRSGGNQNALGGESTGTEIRFDDVTTFIEER